ncbi:PIN domain-containing protein [Tenggerimyces flavus]|uniref:PIN domain-containing protein n=1 Tax=Tenggerimyces flavus TaxID=1708749 RepID=A0ABV7YEP9_9ACTN|nr:PIN domain-containing protein [Tenggerimyces flavus]MBM7787109.1 putative nucleic acid-binding protein [Tenggerimyces flavus]
MSVPIDTTSPLVYDAGALVAAEKGSRRLLLLHTEALASGREITVPSPVLAQVWRGDSRQARLAWVLRGCQIDPSDEEIAKQAGVLLGRSRTRDAIDAIVVATAWKRRAGVVTSDPGDLRKLIETVEMDGHRIAIATV